MLRKNWESNSNTRSPATCHGAIPSLSPGRYFHAITSVDYTLLVCGGMFSKWSDNSINTILAFFTITNTKTLCKLLKQSLRTLIYQQFQKNYNLANILFCNYQGRH